MITFSAARLAVSIQREIGVVLITLAVLVGMPAAAVMAMTNSGALADNSGLQLYTGNASTANTYDYGYCTFWAAQRRAEVGMPIPNNWGDAHTWDDGAVLTGYKVDHTPGLYAIMETDAGALGHVAFVESVGKNGSWQVSEMNIVGWDILSSRSFTPSQAKDYNFIH